MNIYREEFSDNVEVIEQTSRNGELFYGLRIYLQSPTSLINHSTAEDNDLSAVTFWVRDPKDLRFLSNRIHSAIATKFPIV